MKKLIAAAPPLQETIARAIFEEAHRKSWDVAKVHDQWLALSSWEEAGAVMRVLPLAVLKS